MEVLVLKSKCNLCFVFIFSDIVLAKNLKIMASTFEDPEISSSENEDELDQTSKSTGGGKIPKRIQQRKNRVSEKMAELKKLRSEARKQNRAAVQEEERIATLPDNHESRQVAAQWKLDEIERKAEAAAKGDDYELVKLRNVQADRAEKLRIKKEARRDPDEGFKSWADNTSRQYRGLTKTLEPDWRAYNTERERLGHDAFYATMNTQLESNRKDNPNAKNKLAEAITQQQEKRAKYHRRRTYNEDDHINYINERNRKFNLKAERAYGQHTSEVRENLERGTAI